MAIRTATRRKSYSRRKRSAQSIPAYKALLIRYLPAWMLLAAVVLLLPGLLSATGRITIQIISTIPIAIEGLFNPVSTNIAPLFTPQVRYWGSKVEEWAAEYGLDPNLISTIMQIESCGHPTVSSYAGAQGLFQVMPFHFAPGENQIDPETNAKRGMIFLQDCLGWADGDPNMAMACYNGGPSVLSKPYAQWSDQTKRYYTWGSGIYADATNFQSRSDTLDQWLAAGGSALCDRASSSLGLAQ